MNIPAPPQTPPPPHRWSVHPPVAASAPALEAATRPPTPASPRPCAQSFTFANANYTWFLTANATATAALTQDLEYSLMPAAVLIGAVTQGSVVAAVEAQGLTDAVCGRAPPGNRLKRGGGVPLPPQHAGPDSTPKAFPYPNTSPQPHSQPPVTAHPPTAFTSPVTALQPL